MCYTHWTHSSLLQSLPKKEQSGNFIPDLLSLSHLWICPLPKGTAAVKGRHRHSAQQLVRAASGRHYSCPAGRGLQPDSRKGRGEWYQLLRGDQQQFLAPGCSDSASLIMGHFKAAKTKAWMICMISLKNLSLEIFFLFYQFHTRELHWHQEHCIRFTSSANRQRKMTVAHALSSVSLVHCK